MRDGLFIMPAGIDLYAIAVCCLLAACLPAAAQQCQLKIPVAAIASKSSPGLSSVTPSSTTRLPISTAAYTTTSSAPSASSSSQAANTTFAYGTTPVRGVNLCVSRAIDFRESHADTSAGAAGLSWRYFCPVVVTIHSNLGTSPGSPQAFSRTRITRMLLMSTR